VKTGRLRLTDLVRMLSQTPARVFGLWPSKGGIAPGFDADLVLFDPRPERMLAASELHSRAGFSPYEGLPVTGRVVRTILRGQTIYEDGEIVGRPGQGEFQWCKPMQWESLAL
jgi:dihydropyrimidinase